MFLKYFQYISGGFNPITGEAYGADGKVSLKCINDSSSAFNFKVMLTNL